MRYKFDSTFACYSTNYIVATTTIACFVWLSQKHDAEQNNNYIHKSRWLWMNGSKVTSTTSRMTHLVLALDAFSFIISLVSGYVHQILGYYDSTATKWDILHILIVWKIAHSLTVGLIFILFQMSLAMIEQETAIIIPRTLRWIFNLMTSICCIYLFIYHIWHGFSGHDVFHIKYLVPTYAFSWFLYGFFTVFILMAKLCKTFSIVRDDKSSVDTVLHALAPWIFILGGLCMFLAPICSDRKPNTENICPFPDNFNQNAVFHVISMVGFAVINSAEKLAVINRRIQTDKKL